MPPWTAQLWSTLGGSLWSEPHYALKTCAFHSRWDAPASSVAEYELVRVLCLDVMHVPQGKCC